ncbi:MAG: tRNA (adenosine(37)-N6)-dimethylallyltransferase MiaA [Trueperaceae bacterium]|nr:tRNA (adenosine(37)-N6)-dimethylallyltransferase MiaA [Trueperaceae bacterium]
MLAGPTASGKSASAMRLALALAGTPHAAQVVAPGAAASGAGGRVEIVSADAMQVYRGMDVGTAKPTAEERAAVRHHLLDVVDPSEPFSVAQYVRLAEAAIQTVLARGGVPLVTGGTGFYLRALRDGLPTVPPADQAAQAPLWEAVTAGRLGELEAELRAAAPADAARAAGNPRRIVRSLEVLRATGRPPSAFPRLQPRYSYSTAQLLPTVAELRPRIALRTAARFEGGLVAEVAELLRLYPEQPTALQAIGYKEVASHLRGESSEAEAREAVELGTVRYAKRQLTWFRSPVEAPALRIAATGEGAFGRLREWLLGVIERL